VATPSYLWLKNVCNKKADFCQAIFFQEIGIFNMQVIGVALVVILLSLTLNIQSINYYKNEKDADPKD
jgi:hypothetical protein